MVCRKTAINSPAPMAWSVPDRTFSLGHGLFAGDFNVTQKRVIETGQRNVLPVQGLCRMQPVQQPLWPGKSWRARSNGGAGGQDAGGHRLSFHLAFVFVIWFT